MATPNLPGQSRAAQNPPGSGGNTPISFRPNVNRAKTKRWAEAKSVSYDGGDWGDDDSEEDEEEEPGPPPPPYISQRTGSSSELSSRRLSGIAETPTSSQGSQQKTLPFVRPADLYKRAQENSPAASPVVNTPASAPAQPVVAGNDAPRVDTTAAPPSNAAPSIGLPELKRMSGFGTDFLGGSGDSNSPQQQQLEPQPPSSQEKEPTLRHNSSQDSQQSQGFTSVVHQAFDVPETPNSTAGTVSRTNSDGTSAVSPIISRSHDDRTPTIPEEPAESTPTDASKNGPPFVPGHRRDLSLPSPDNSPSKRPVVMDNEAPAAGQAEIAAASPQGQLQSPGQSLNSATSPTSPEKDFVAPLKFGSGQSGTEGYRGNIPTIVPAIGSTGNSPQDTDNDRLREEIMRSLSREGSQEPEPTSQPQVEDSKKESIPHQHEKYWDGQTGPRPDETSRPLVSDSGPGLTSSQPLGSQDPHATMETPREGATPTATTAAPAAAFTGAEIPTKPRLARRFSWESEDEPAPQPAEVQPTAPAEGESEMALQESQPTPDDYFNQQPTEEFRDPPKSDDEDAGGPPVEKPRLSIVPPVPEGGFPPPQIAGPVDDLSSQGEASRSVNVAPSSTDEAKLKGFREILGYSSPEQRIQTFEDTRTQFAKLDTGLNHWVQLTVQSHPEHQDVVEQSQSLTSAFPQGSPARTRFPKLTSLGTLGVNDGTPTSTTHNRKPSAHIGTIVNRTNVEQRGKDFLHTAGIFGGKAGETAKGLFAKGRSKFRASGDKVPSPIARKSQHFTFSAEPSNGSEEKGNFSLRNSTTFGSLSGLKLGRNSTSKEREDERGGKRLKPSRSLDFLRLENLKNAQAEKLEPNEPISMHPPAIKTESPPTQSMPTESEFASDLEQEMIAALGLSPVKQQSDPMETANQNSASSSAVTDQHPQGQGTSPKGGNAVSDGAVNPVEEQEQAPLPSIHPVVPSTEPTPTTSSDDVKAGSVLPEPPAKTPTEEYIPDDLALTYRLRQHMKQPSVSTLGADEKSASPGLNGDFDAPPSPMISPSKDETDVNGDYNHDISDESDLAAQSDEKGDTGDKNETPPKDEPALAVEKPRTTSKTFAMPSSEKPFAQEDTSEFESMFPPSSAEILESKRRSISGLPPSAPNMQSPLRNEVRYSPATRSSMRSFGSFGRQSTNSKGVRPTTPANDLPLPRVEAVSTASTGDSTVNKIKSFGKRRRTSVGDLLTTVQGGFQGLQQKVQQPSTAQSKENGEQKKRTFSKISGLFNRQVSPSPESPKNGRRGSKDKFKSFQIPDFLPNQFDRVSSSRQGDFFSNPFAQTEPETRKSESAFSPRLSTEAESKPRTSLSIPQSPSANAALLSGRFYSQVQSGESPLSPQHSRARSMPMTIPGQQPLSPVAPSDSGRSDSSKSQPREMEESAQIESQEKQDELKAEQSSNEQTPEQKRTSEEEPPQTQPTVTSVSPEQKRISEDELPQTQTTETFISPEPEEKLNHVEEIEDRFTPEPSSGPEDTVQPRKLLDTQAEPHSPVEQSKIAVSGMSMASEHPFRDESNSLHRTSTPVELAVRGDDSSEEIIMSPTAYPGQEWTPMNYY